MHMLMNGVFFSEKAVPSSSRWSSKALKQYIWDRRQHARYFCGSMSLSICLGVSANRVIYRDSIAEFDNLTLRLFKTCV